jgi:excisionase family DNA binding protein
LAGYAGGSGKYRQHIVRYRFGGQWRMNNFPQEVITATIPEFGRVSGLGRSKIYKLIDEGTLKSVKIGKRRLIFVPSYRQMVEEQLAGHGARSAA